MTTRTIEIQEAVHGRNDEIAARNHAIFHEAGVLVLNVMSAPGSGKTELLARTLLEIGFAADAERVPAGKMRIGVIVGDIATDNDAQRIARSGASVTQITTGGYCHLDAGMIEQAALGFDLGKLDVLIIENVGNMVCPATFDLGEDVRVALLSVTEGEDKPLKYPTLFKRADLVIVNKIDLAEAAQFDKPLALANLQGVAPQAPVVCLSAKTGQGMDVWYDYLRGQVRKEV